MFFKRSISQIEDSKPSTRRFIEPTVQQKLKMGETNEEQIPRARRFIEPTVQQKLKIGEANDKYEQEADRVADKVVNKSKGDAIQKKEGEEELQQKPIANEVTPLVQKMESTDEESVQKKEEEPIQKMEDEEPIQKMEEEEAVQKKQNSPTNNQPSIESRLNSSKGKGQKLSGNVKNEMESGFGNDFSNVSIHTDQNAAQMNQEMGAKAFAHGNDVYFNKGEFNPETSEGKHLLAHELTHTIQQKGMVQKKVQTKLKISGTDVTTRTNFLGKINDSTTNKFKLSVGGLLELVNPSDVGTDVFTKKMIGAIKNSQLVNLKLILKNDRVFIDSFASGKVDSSDMLGMSTNVFKSWLLHFVIERFAITDYETNKTTATRADFLKAHKKGYEAQEEFLKELYPKKTIKYVSEGFDNSTKVVDASKNGTIDYIFKFTDVNYVFTQPIKNGVTLENIVKSSLKIIK